MVLISASCMKRIIAVTSFSAGVCLHLHLEHGRS